MSESADIGARKAELRARIKLAVSEMSEQDRVSGSRSIAHRLSSSPAWQHARSVMVFLGDPSEPNLDPVIESALASGVSVCAPRMDWDSRTMVPRVLDAIDLIETRRHGIREPVEQAPSVSPETLDLVVVPGVAFDASGHRLGRGAGFYDRFLAGLPQSTHIVGVCFEVQRVESVPRAPHDVPVRMLVTENGVYPDAAGDPAG